MFMLFTLVNKKRDFSEEKYFFSKNNLRKEYGGVFHGGIFLGEIFPRAIHRGRI